MGGGRAAIADLVSGLRAGRCRPALTRRPRTAVALGAAAARTVNRINSDGCMSTNDTVTLLASGASGISPDELELTRALSAVCHSLAQQLITDAEGAAHDIAITTVGAATETVLGGRVDPARRESRTRTGLVLVAVAVAWEGPRAQEARAFELVEAFGAPWSVRMLEIDAIGMYDTAAEEMGKVLIELKAHVRLGIVSQTLRIADQSAGGSKPKGQRGGLPLGATACPRTSSPRPISPRPLSASASRNISLAMNWSPRFCASLSVRLSRLFRSRPTDTSRDRRPHRRGPCV